VLNSSPGSKVAGGAFRNKGVDMRIPFEVSAKGMKDADEAGSKAFCLIHLGKHTKKNITDRMKETVQKRTVMKKINTKFFWNCKNAMTMNTRNKFRGHVKRAKLIVFITTRRAETTFTAKRNEFQFTTKRAAKHSTALRGIATVNHTIYIFNNGLPGMKFINDVFIIVSKNGL